MPLRAPRICSCGNTVASGARCVCERARKAEHDRRRPNASERGYDARWRCEANAFLKVNPSCKRCGEQATVVDHVVPHRGDPLRFWNRSNWQALCTTCHTRWKQSIERRTSWAVNGAPGGGEGLRQGTPAPAGVNRVRKNEIGSFETTGALP